MAAETLQYQTVSIEDVDAVAKRVGDVDVLGFPIYRDSGGPFEEAFSALEAPKHALVFAAGPKDKHFPGRRIRDVDIVARIDGDALRLQHRVLGFLFAFQKLVLMLLNVEDMDPTYAGVGDNHAPAGIHCH